MLILGSQLFIYRFRIGYMPKYLLKMLYTQSIILLIKVKHYHLYNQLYVIQLY